MVSSLSKCLNSLQDGNEIVLLKFVLSCVQVAIHAIGDKANDLILNMYESVFSTNGVRDRRFRVKIFSLNVDCSNVAYASQTFSFSKFYYVLHDWRKNCFQIEHAQHLAPETPARFGELGIVASVQV